MKKSMQAEMVIDDFDLQVLREIDLPGSQRQIKYGAALMVSCERLSKLGLVIPDFVEDHCPLVLTHGGRAILGWDSLEKLVVEVLSGSEGEHLIEPIKKWIKERFQHAWRYEDPAPRPSDLTFSAVSGFTYSCDDRDKEMLIQLNKIYRDHH